MTGDFFIKINGQDVRMRICNWSQERFCDLEGGISINKMFEVLNDMSIKNVKNLLRAAAEYPYIESSQPAPSWSDIEISNWIDENGGVAVLIMNITSTLAKATDANLPDQKKKATRKLPGQK